MRLNMTSITIQETSLSWDHYPLRMNNQSRTSTRGTAPHEVCFHRSHYKFLVNPAPCHLPPLITLPHQFRGSANELPPLTLLQWVAMGRYLAARMGRQTDRPQIRCLQSNLLSGKIPLTMSGHSFGVSRQMILSQPSSGKTTTAII